MATPAHACARILSALEELVMQEAVVLTAGDLAAVDGSQPGRSAGDFWSPASDRSSRASLWGGGRAGHALPRWLGAD